VIAIIITIMVLELSVSSARHAMARGQAIHQLRKGAAERPRQRCWRRQYSVGGAE
jgi:hypothetical protein